MSAFLMRRPLPGSVNLRSRGPYNFLSLGGRISTATKIEAAYSSSFRPTPSNLKDKGALGFFPVCRSKA